MNPFLKFRVIALKLFFTAQVVDIFLIISLIRPISSSTPSYLTLHDKLYPLIS